LKEIFKEFNLDTTSKININNRKIISWFIDSLWLSEKLEQISIVIDKVDKITEEHFKKDLEKLELAENEIEKIFKFIRYDVKLENIDLLWTDFWVENEDFLSWVNELSKVLKNLELLWLDSNNIVVNLSIVRWLWYYTWTVFETFIDWDRKLWSIWSGWRYEKLTTFIDPKTSYSWVWFSLWITRLEEYLFEKQDKEKLKKTTSDYLVVNFESTFKESIKLYKKLISEWKSVEIYPESDKLQKQFKYADKKGIRYTVILWEDELKNGKYIVKDMMNWSSEEINF
jgi:histidyl-tRNA synthetase